VEELLAISSRGVVAPAGGSESHAVREAGDVLNCVTTALVGLKASNTNNDSAKAPIIVLNGIDTVFMSDHAQLAQHVLDWARLVTQNQLATVLVLCDENSAEDLQDKSHIRCFQVALEDASREQGRAYLQEQLPKAAASEAEIAYAAAVLGGRLSDLNELVHRCTRLQQPLDVAINDLVESAVTLVRGTVLQLASAPQADRGAGPEWTREQAWYIVSALAKHEELEYEKVLFSSAFNGEDAPLHALQRAGLIRLQRHVAAVGTPNATDPPGTPAGRQQQYIQAARPLLRVAFDRLVTDPMLASGLRLGMLKQSQVQLVTQLEDIEKEMAQVLTMMDAAQTHAQHKLKADLVARAKVLGTALAKVTESLSAVADEQSRVALELAIV
jgi:hypothetical protein